MNPRRARMMETPERADGPTHRVRNLSVSSESVLLMRLFVASYAPLALIFSVQLSETVWPPQENLSLWILLLIGIWGSVDAYRLPRGALRTNRVQVRLRDVRDESGQVAAYVATYLLPFIGIQLTGWRDAMGILFYFFVLFLVFIRSDLPLVNPTLYLTGWRVVSANRVGRLQTTDLGDGQPEHEEVDRVLMLIPRSASVPHTAFSVVAFGRFLVYRDEDE